MMSKNNKQRSPVSVVLKKQKKNTTFVSRDNNDDDRQTKPTVVFQKCQQRYIQKGSASNLIVESQEIFKPGIARNETAHLYRRPSISGGPIRTYTHRPHTRAMFRTI